MLLDYRVLSAFLLMTTFTIIASYSFVIIMVIIMVGEPAFCIGRFVSAIFSLKARSLIKSKPIAHTLWVLGTLLIIAGIGYTVASDRLPSDKSFVDYFNTHESTYTTLASMLNKDKNITRIYPDDGIAVNHSKYTAGSIIIRSPSEYGVQADRFEKYKNLLKSIGATFNRQNDGSLLFSKGGWGFASYGARWSYCWFVNPPPADQTIDSVDHFKQSINHNLPEEPHYFRYRLIKGNWYIVVAW